MTNTFLIHGSFGTPFENWFPWLQEKLTDNKITCYIPHMPTPEYQNFENWSDLLNCYRNIGLINKNTIFIGHSLGPIFLARYITENSLNIKAYISVSGFNKYLAGMEDFDNVNKPFFMEDGNLSTLKQFVSIRHCFISDNDPYLPLHELKKFADLIQAEPHLIKQGGHFNTNSGYTTFPTLLKLLLKIA